MSVFGLLALFLSPVLGGLLVMQLKSAYARQLKFVLTFCGGFLFSTAILHLLPEVFRTNHHYEGFLILVGFFFQMLLEKFSEGVEHGHIHLDGPLGHDHSHHDHTHYHKKTNTLSLGLLLSLSIHSLVEGIPLNGTFKLDQPFWQNPLLIGVVIHKFPSAFALMTVLKQTGLTTARLWTMLLGFALMTPLGVGIGYLLLQSDNGVNGEMFHILLALATGSFLQIATTILFESTTNHQFNVRHVLMAFLGGALAFMHLH